MPVLHCGGYLGDRSREELRPYSPDFIVDDWKQFLAAWIALRMRSRELTLHLRYGKMFINRIILEARYLRFEIRKGKVLINEYRTSNIERLGNR